MIRAWPMYVGSWATTGVSTALTAFGAGPVGMATAGAVAITAGAVAARKATTDRRRSLGRSIGRSTRGAGSRSSGAGRSAGGRSAAGRAARSLAGRLGRLGRSAGGRSAAGRSTRGRSAGAGRSTDRFGRSGRSRNRGGAGRPAGSPKRTTDRRRPNRPTDRSKRPTDRAKQTPKRPTDTNTTKRPRPDSRPPATGTLPDGIKPVTTPTPTEEITVARQPKITKKSKSDLGSSSSATFGIDIAAEQLVEQMDALPMMPTPEDQHAVYQAFARLENTLSRHLSEYAARLDDPRLIDKAQSFESIRKLADMHSQQSEMCLTIAHQYQTANADGIEHRSTPAMRQFDHTFDGEE